MSQDPLVNPADRRTSRRNPVQVRLELSNKKQSFSARTVDVSRGGLFAAASELRPVGTLLRIKVVGPKGDPIYAVGVVVRTFASIADGGTSDQGTHTMGLAIALTSTSESWDLFWDDVSAVDVDEDDLDGLDDLEDEPS
ncbi:MAG: PilZ domain-containing protein [Deltaproteobacteria bacterium]|nr:PilZ domain-containing protein [Deltaproteobacteria bacterium]